MATNPCRYVLKQEGVAEKDWPVFKSKEALATHLNKTPTLIEALKGAPNLNERTPTGDIAVNGEVQPIVTEGEQQGVQPAAIVGAGQGEAEVGGVGVGGEKSDADIEKRMTEIEGAKIGTPELAEFNALEKEMEKRERATVFNVPLEKVNDAVDALMKKEKEQPNGYGSFIEKRDARETKEVADKYLNAKELTDAELRKDFKDAVMGNPDTWYADGLKLRESMKEASNRGIDTQNLVAEVENEFIKDGYTSKDAKETVARRLSPIFKGSQKVNEKQIAEQSLKETPKAESPKVGLKQKASSFRERAEALKNAQPKEDVAEPKKTKPQPAKSKQEQSDRTNFLLSKKGKYNGLPKTKKAIGANLLQQIKEEAEALGYRVFLTKNGVDIVDQKTGKKVIKRGVDRAFNKEENETKRKAILWAEDGFGGIRLAILAYFAGGGKVGISGAELGKGSPEEMAALRRGLVVKKGDNIDTYVIEGIRAGGMYISEEGEGDVMAEIQDVLRSYESRESMLDDIVGSYEDQIKLENQNLKEDEEYRNKKELDEAAQRNKDADEHYRLLDENEKQQILNDYENLEGEILGRNVDQARDGNVGDISPSTTTKEEIAERKSKTKKLKYEYDSAQAEYAKKKEAFDKNAQQNQANMFAATPQDEMLFKNNLKEQKEFLDKAKARVDKTKAEYLESKKVLDDMLEGQVAITFADNLRDKAAELRASSGQGLSVLPNALATAYEVFADILDAASDIKEAIRQWKETKEYKALSEQDVKIANKSIVDEFGDVNLQNETAERRPEQGGNGRGRTEGRRIAPLEGAPSVPGINGPDSQLVAVAEQYAQENGIPLTRQAEYVEVDADRATRISDAYAAMKHEPQNHRVKEAYQNLIRQTIAQYEALVKAGYKFWFLDTNIPSNIKYVESPYNAIRDLRQNKEMGVFPTTDGFGSSELDVSDNPLMEETQFMWPVGGPDGQLKPVLANDLFRAVHDAFGHGLEGSGFRARGEENAWQAHVRLFTGSAIGAITTETRGQNSWLNFGPHGENNRTAKTEDTIFADQKTGLMPEWTWTEGRAGDMMNEQQSSEIFTQVDDAINKTGVEATAARRELKEKFGTDNYQKAIKITREFDKITDRLEAEGKITKKCP